MKLRIPHFEFTTMRARLLTWLMLLLLIPVILLVVIGLGYAEEQLRQRAEADLHVSARILSATLDSQVDEQLENNRILSRSPYLQQALAEFAAAYRTGPVYSMAYQELEDRYWSYLAYYAEKHNLNDLLLVDPEGHVVFSATQSKLYGQNLEHVDFTGSALRRSFEQALWQMDSVLEIGNDGGDQYASLAVPVVANALLGVLIQVPSPDVLHSLIGEGDGGDDSYQALYLAAPGGVFRRLRDGYTTVSGSAFNRLLTSAYLGQDVDTEVEDQDDTWLISMKPLPVLNAVVVARQRKSTALAAVRDLRITATVGAAVMLIVLVLVGLRVSNNLTAPLHALAFNFERIGKGQRQVRVDENRRDELGMLAREFNRMAESLRNTQAQLVRSEKMASIGHLAAGVAHEINNPMSIVTANIDTMRQYTEVYVMLVDLYDRYIRAVTLGQPEEAETLAQEIIHYQKQEDIQFVYDDMKSLLEDSLSGLARVRHIVGSLRVFSELDKAEDQWVDLSECLQHVLAALDERLKHNIHIEMDIRIKQPLRFRLEQMRRVFQAVIDNACKACAEGGRVDIRAWSEADQHIIEVQDNGAGIDEARMPHIFDPFFTTRPVGEGLGLGLSVSHSIVEAHGGSMRVSSRPGQGTTVQILLPKGEIRSVA